MSSSQKSKPSDQAKTQTGLQQHADTQRHIRHEDLIVGTSKAMAILDCFGPDRQRLNTSIAAEKTGITRAAARRHLMTLHYLGYLEEQAGYYTLAPKILKFAAAYLSSAQLPRVCQPILNMLTAQTALIYSVMVLEGHEAITIARSSAQPHSDRVHPYGLHLGNRLLAHATSAGKVLLAALDQAQQQHWIERFPLKRLTAYSCVDPTALLQQLAEIHQQDWCYCAEEHELGVHALAVPILDQQGHIVAALNIVTPTARCSKAYLIQQILPLLQHAAQQLRQVI